MANYETAYIQVYINGHWSQISSGILETIQQDIEQLRKNCRDPIRAVDSNGRIVAM